MGAEDARGILGPRRTLTVDRMTTVERLLDQLFGARIVGSTDLGVTGAPVLRIELDGDYPGVGRTVIAKSPRQAAAGWGINPSHLENERLALEHLTQAGLASAGAGGGWPEASAAGGTAQAATGGTPSHAEAGAGTSRAGTGGRRGGWVGGGRSVAPRLLGAADGVVLMADLGPGPVVQDLLLSSGDADAATAGLIGLARTAGVLHASADRLSGFRPAHQNPFLDRPVDAWTEIASAAKDLGFPSPVGVSEDLAALEHALTDERFRGFTQGDLTPNNAVLVEGTVHLVDYEVAGERHLGMDAACLRLPFPQYGHWAVLPETLLTAMDQAYRDELGRAGDTEYERFMAVGCLAWAIVRASRLRVIATPEDAVRRRTQIVQTLTAANETAFRTGSFPALTAWFQALIDEMKNRWDEARLEPRKFPVFS